MKHSKDQEILEHVLQHVLKIEQKINDLEIIIKDSLKAKESK